MTVKFVEHLGAESLIHAALEGASGEITLRHAGHANHVIGDTIRANIHAKDMHFFSIDNQKRLNLG